MIEGRPDSKQLRLQEEGFKHYSAKGGHLLRGEFKRGQEAFTKATGIQPTRGEISVSPTEKRLASKQSRRFP